MKHKARTQVGVSERASQEPDRVIDIRIEPSEIGTDYSKKSC